MRIFPILAAIAVSAFMYMAIFERQTLLNTLGLTSAATVPSEDIASLSRYRCIRWDEQEGSPSAIG